ncbi:uncharacterized protein LOC107361022 [Tetranychus urticae]|uniref:uncharacterized protein LOC107361022 n=2 Tax=Tetranychus urticae TaxID=32264 RepID=UPI00077B9316|nr:uncharacterized protein LOC107361022 [Tetranychus urticae]
MNSKMLFAFVLAANICAITVTAEVYSYKVNVRMADKEFDSHEGKLKISVTSKNAQNTTQEDFELTPNDVEMKKDKNYTAIISSTAPLDTITSVYLQWTREAPNDTDSASNKPTLYFESVSLTSFKFRPHPDFCICVSRYFCPETTPIGIEHAGGATFNFCNSRKVFSLYRYYEVRSVKDLKEAECSM